LLRHLWLQEISVLIRSEIVVLRGQVSTYEEKRAADEIARSIFGGKGV
jgi:osmotically-inducible protein OsmY